MTMARQTNGEATGTRFLLMLLCILERPQPADVIGTKYSTKSRKQFSA